MAETKNKNKYFEGIGRRKTAVARVRIFEDGKGEFIVNDKNLNDYFPVSELQIVAKEAFSKAPTGERFSTSVKVKGGGVRAQAEAIRLGIARSIEKYDPELRTELKRAGFLKRDPRVIERKKFGLKKARKAAQWSKR